MSDPFNPNDFEMVPAQPMPLSVVRVIEYLEKKAGSAALRQDAAVNTESDWELVMDIWRVWKRLWPHEYAAHIEDIKRIKEGLYNPYAAADKAHAGSTGNLRHIAEIPGRFDRLFQIFFPRQDYTKAFLRKLVKRIPDMGVPHKV